MSDAEIAKPFSYESLPDHLRAPFARAVPVAAALHKAGHSHYIFMRMADHQAALRQFSMALIQDDEPYARKLAAYGLGYLEDAAAVDFDRVYDAEIKRERTGDSMQVFNAQSTVEDLVFSAVRLVKDNRNPETGVIFLQRIVVEAITGVHYWNSSQYAMASLMNTDAGRFESLFRGWSAWVDGTPPGHASNPDFSTERGWRDAIRGGKTGQIIDLLTQQETEAVDVTLAPEERAAVDALLSALTHARQQP